MKCVYAKVQALKDIKVPCGSGKVYSFTKGTIYDVRFINNFVSQIGIDGTSVSVLTGWIKQNFKGVKKDA